jgi:hypothetical protein
MRERQLKTITMIWAVFLFTPLVFAFALYTSLGQMVDPAALPNAALPVQIVAVIVAMVSFVIWRGGLVPQNLRKAGTGDAIAARWFTTHLFLYVLNESVALIGCVLGFLTHDFRAALPLFGASFVLTALMYPNRATLDAALKPL